MSHFIHRAALAAALVGAVVASSPTMAHAEKRGVQFRVGVGAAGGGFVGAIHGADLGVQGRVGVQWTPSFATYAMADALVGGFVPSIEGAETVGVSHVMLMFEGTVGMIQLALGPSADWMIGCYAEPAQSSCGGVGAFFGVDARVAWRYQLLTVSLDVHPTLFAHDTVATWISLGVGIDMTT